MTSRNRTFVEKPTNLKNWEKILELFLIRLHFRGSFENTYICISHGDLWPNARLAPVTVIQNGRTLQTAESSELYASAIRTQTFGSAAIMRNQHITADIPLIIIKDLQRCFAVLGPCFLLMSWSDFGFFNTFTSYTAVCVCLWSSWWCV